MFGNPRRGRKARNFTTNVPKILGLENWRWVSLLFLCKKLKFKTTFNKSSRLNIKVFSFLSNFRNFLVNINPQVNGIINSKTGNYWSTDVLFLGCFGSWKLLWKFLLEVLFITELKLPRQRRPWKRNLNKRNCVLSSSSALIWPLSFPGELTFLTWILKNAIQV